MGACDDEKEIFDKEMAERTDAENDYRDAYNDYLDTFDAENSTDADLARCADSFTWERFGKGCADKEAAHAKADTDKGSAGSAREDAYERWQEADFWADVATDLYCECLIAHPEEA